MTVWTAGRWHSAMHRGATSPARLKDQDRLSIAYFHQPSPTAWITPAPGCTRPQARPGSGQRADAYFAGNRREAFITERLVNRAARRRPEPDGRR